MHLSDELLSAYLDGELEPSETTAAAAHLGICASCTRTASLFGSLDERLTAIPALACASALTLVSADLDGELAGAEATVAAAHLAGCAGCRDDVLRWSVADQALAGLPLSRPSRTVDAAIAALGAPGRSGLSRLGIPAFRWPVPVVAVAMAIALVISWDLPQPGTSPNAALVASVQVSVLNSATNILYVLDPAQGTVSALDATTLEQKSVITVGGRPTALALNSVTNTILVLDAGAKTVTEIDGVRNTITSSTAVQVPGTPTSLQVDPNGKLVVTSVVANTAPAAAAPAGAISLFNSGTKKLETVKAVDVAPTRLVVDPTGQHALLVSKDGTTLVDAGTYQSLARYGGGIAAAFGAAGDLAILSGSGTDGGLVTLTRQGTAIAVGGVPWAITALAGSGYAVLTDSGTRSRIVFLSADGAITGTIETPLGGRDLAFDQVTRQLAVVGMSGVSNLVVPAEVLAAAKPTVTTTTPSLVPAAPTQPAASAAPAAPAAAVAAPPIAQPATVVAPSAGKVPTDARAVWPGTYLVTIAAHPTVVTSDADRIWFVDDANVVNALHMRTGELYPLAHLPRSAVIARIAVSPNHVYLTDPKAGRLYVLTIGTEQLSSVAVPFLLITNDIVASPDERLWLATKGLGLVSFDPRGKRLESTIGSQDVSAVATDPLGRIWMGVPGRQVLDVYDPLTDRLTELNLPHEGTITALAIDRGGTVWAGTDTGQLFAIRNDRLEGAAALGRPVDDLLIDPSGRAWFVTHTGSEVLYGLAAGNGITVHAPGTASGPLFDSLGRAWQADGPAGGFYVTLSPGGQP